MKITIELEREDFDETDKLLSEIEYLEHHNFMLIKK
jgi:hypothetical protein